MTSNPSLQQKKGKTNQDLVFICKKCEHNLYLINGLNLTGRQIYKKLAANCPNCGEEWEELWILSRAGDYKIEQSKS